MAQQFKPDKIEARASILSGLQLYIEIACNENSLHFLHYPIYKSLFTVDSLSTISPLSTTSSTCLSLSDIFAMSNRHASAAICSTGCSTAVIVG